MHGQTALTCRAVPRDFRFPSWCRATSVAAYAREEVLFLADGV
ncbi:hypothetical protein [Bacillus sp. 3255]|nr:hypothetical protein [Bacillus sp. 3255]MDR6884347.1 O-methyltransferase involved in polyketide biosynthesis [Bacillus sp. 3255]